MDAATLTIDLDKRRCCYCSPSKTRCQSDTCICYKQGRQCGQDCQSSNWSGDCLNKSVVHCRCTKQYTPGSHRSYTYCNHDSSCPCFRYNEACTFACGCRGDCANLFGVEKNVLNYEHPKLDRPLCGCSCSGRGGCRKFKKCLCLQSLSYCGLGCKCKRECSNTKTHFELSKFARNALFDPEQCPSGSTAILHIIAANYGFQIEFTTPNLQVMHAEEILCRVLTRAMSMYAIPIQHIIVYTPNSPCFHQDCQPRCEIVDDCHDGKACANALSILFRQLKKLTKNTHMEMTVRFLNPYVLRGDLYTKRAILAMMEHGIRVEPLTIKEWSDLMKDSAYKHMKKRSASSDRLFNRQSPKEPTEATLTPNSSAYRNLWNLADMDRFVRLTQHYINDCRRTLGYSECHWSSAFHDLLKMTVLTCAGASEKLKHISIHLSPPLISHGASVTRDSSFQEQDDVKTRRQHQMKRQDGLSVTEEMTNSPGQGPGQFRGQGQGPDPTTSTSNDPTSKKFTSTSKSTHRIRCNSGPSSFRSSKFRIVDESVESISKSVNSIELDPDPDPFVDSPMTIDFGSSSHQSIDHSTSTNYTLTRNCLTTTNRPTDSLENQKHFNHQFSTGSIVSLQAPAAVVADKILLNLSGRNMMDIEQQEIKSEVVGAIDAIQQQLNALMLYLDQKIASVPV